VVRLTWTLKVRGRDAAETTSVEPGIDIFRRQVDGSWRISRYIAYESP
jgi:steroid delta-isomerase